jgi:hypothetical protein
MKPDDVRLERELASMRPRPPSQDLQRRLAAELSIEPRRRPNSRVTIALALAGSVVLAVLLVAVLGRRQSEHIERPSSEPAMPVAAALDEALPSVWTYRRAVADPAYDLDELLDRHRGQNASDSTPSRSLSVSALRQPSWTGEL